MTRRSIGTLSVRSAGSLLHVSFLESWHSPIGSYGFSALVEHFVKLRFSRQRRWEVRITASARVYKRLPFRRSDR